MMLRVGGYRLRDVPDKEYQIANDLTRQIKGRDLDYCPTCKSKLRDVPGEEPQKREYLYNGQTQQCDCQEQTALFTRYLLAGIPEQYMRLDWEDYDGSPQARQFVDDYLSRWQQFRDHGFGVEFGGPKLGIGKTFAATYLGKELIKKRQRVLFVPFVEMVAAFERSDAEAFEDKVRMTPYVIIDDIMPPVSDRQQNFYHTRFEAVIRHRTNYNLPTIITTNLTSDKLEEYYPRTYSLLAAKQKRINMEGQDFRGVMGLWNEELIANNEVRPLT